MSDDELRWRRRPGRPGIAAKHVLWGPWRSGGAVYGWIERKGHRFHIYRSKPGTPYVMFIATRPSLMAARMQLVDLVRDSVHGELSS